MRIIKQPLIVKSSILGGFPGNGGAHKKASLLHMWDWYATVSSLTLQIHKMLCGSETELIFFFIEALLYPNNPPFC